MNFFVCEKIYNTIIYIQICIRTQLIPEGVKNSPGLILRDIIKTIICIMETTMTKLFHVKLGKIKLTTSIGFDL